MQSVVILSAAVGVASAATKQVVFAVDYAASDTIITLFGGVTGAAFEAADTVHVPAGIFSDDCFDISLSLPFGNFSAYGKFNCNATGVVDTYGMYSDNKCSVKLAQPPYFIDPMVPTGLDNPATLGWNFKKNPKLNMPFSDYESISGYCPATPLQVFLRTPFEEPGCNAADQSVAIPVGTATQTGFAFAFPAVMPYASGKCYTTDAGGDMVGKFLRVTTAGIKIYDNKKSTSMTMTSTQCTDTGFTTGSFFSSGVCTCSPTLALNVAVRDSVCAAVGAACLKADGSAPTGAEVGTCAFVAGTVTTTGAAVAGTAVNQCEHVGGGITAGTFSPSSCVCYADSQCSLTFFCLQANGQRATAGVTGKCGVWTKLPGVVSNPLTEAAYTACAPSAHQAVYPLNVCDQTTQSIWKVASANMYAVSAASVVVAMTSLFA